jgi:hypothetical protein
MKDCCLARNAAAVTMSLKDWTNCNCSMAGNFIATLLGSFADLLISLLQ